MTYHVIVGRKTAIRSLESLNIAIGRSSIFGKGLQQINDMLLGNFTSRHTCRFGSARKTSAASGEGTGPAPAGWEAQFPSRCTSVAS